MTDIPPAPGPDATLLHTGDALSGVDQLKDKGKDAADAIDQAFTRAGDSIAKSLARAASDGKVSLADLASVAISALESFGKTAVAGSGGGIDGLGQALSSVVSSLFSGARADGGPVSAGGAYLVGERGPEVFRPWSSGEVATSSGGSGGGSGAVVNVTIAGGGAPQLLRSEAQIAAALARAVALGGR